MKRLNLYLFLPFAWLAWVSVHAQGELQTKDYGKVFQFLHQQGLPVVPTNAVYCSTPPGDRMFQSTWSIREPRPLGMRGNSWLVREVEGEKDDFVIGHSTPGSYYLDDEELKLVRLARLSKISDTNRSSHSNIERYEPNAQDAYEYLTGLGYFERDLQADLKLLLGVIRKPLDEDGAGSLSSSTPSNFYRAAELRRMNGLARMLFFSVHLYDRGLTKEANEIAGWLFDRSGDRKALLKAAVSLLRDDHYGSLMEAYVTHRQLDRLAQDVETYAQTHATSWAHSNIAMRLVETLKKQLGGTGHSYQAPGGTRLDDRQLELIHRLCKTQPPKGGFGEAVGWITGTGTDVQDPSAASLLHELGIEALPALLAMLANPEFANLPPKPHTFQMLGVDLGSVMSNKSTSFETAQYDALPKPMSVSVIARPYLENILFLENGEEIAFHQLDNKTLRDIGWLF